MAVGSIFAVGSTGTLIISLGSQEIAKGVVSGVEMTASDRFYEGDNVHFGDGTQGYIQKMGKLCVCSKFQTTSQSLTFTLALMKAFFVQRFESMIHR